MSSTGAEREPRRTHSASTCASAGAAGSPAARERPGRLARARSRAVKHSQRGRCRGLAERANLQLPLLGLGGLREDVNDERGPVSHAAGRQLLRRPCMASASSRSSGRRRATAGGGHLLQVAQLPRGQLVVKDDCGPRRAGQGQAAPRRKTCAIDTPACLCLASARPARLPAPQACPCRGTSSAGCTSSQLRTRPAHEAAPQETGAGAWMRTRRQAGMHALLRTGCAESSDWYVWPMTCSPAVCARRRSSSRLSVVLRAKRLRCPLICTPAWQRHAASGRRQGASMAEALTGLQESPSRRAPAPAHPPTARLRSLPARLAPSGEALGRAAQLGATRRQSVQSR